jgi:O-antigen/teichoic acid export membrane protein
MRDAAATARDKVVASIPWNISGQSAALIVGFGVAVATARVLGPTDRGELGVLVTLPNLAVALASVGIPVAVGFQASRSNARDRGLVGNALLVALALAALFVGAAWLLRGALADAFSHGRNENLWVLAATLVPLTFLDWTLANYALGKQRFRGYNVALVSSRLLVFACTIVLAAWLDLGIGGCLIAVVLGEVAMVTSLLVRSWVRPHPDLRLLAETVRYGGLAQVGAVFQLMNYRLDVLILQFFRPLSEVGYYLVAQAMAEVVLAIGRAYQSSVLPAIASTESDRERAAASIAGARGHGVAALVGVALTAVAAPLVIYFGYGPEFAPAIAPTLILLPAMWFLGSGNVVSADLRGRGRPGLSSGLCGGAVVLTVCFDLLLIPPFGMIGAAVASVIAYVTYGVTSLLVLRGMVGCTLRALCSPTMGDLRRVVRPFAHRAFGNA